MTSNATSAYGRATGAVVAGTVERRPASGHVEPAVVRQTFEQDVAERELRREPSGALVLERLVGCAHSPITRITDPT